MKDIAKFDAEYNSFHEDVARRTRGVFRKKFPVESLKSMTLDDYVVGHRDASFCKLVEFGTRAWAGIQGANAFKFGIYYGKEKHDPELRYRFSQKFGSSQNEAFANVKRALLNLVDLGARDEPDYGAIDMNPLSQMFKAKILSLYYPKRFLAVCSAEHLKLLAKELGFERGLPASKYQNLLLAAKRREPATRSWSEPKFMAYLYKTYVHPDRDTAAPIERPKAKRHRWVDFDELQRNRTEIGKIAEEFALEWEKERLRGADLEHMIERIADRRRYPSHGHDFRSFSAPDEERFIEVKSVARMPDGHRFFLSENERETSLSAQHRSGYYFYLVYFDGKRKPVELEPILAEKLYPNADLVPTSYEARFDRRSLSERRR
jgi:hypothetical protein